MKRLIRIVLACALVLSFVIPPMNVQAASKDSSKEITVSIATYGKKITYTDEKLKLFDDEKSIYVMANYGDEGEIRSYVLFDLSGAKIKSKKLSGKVVSETYYDSDYLLSLGFEEKIIPQIEFASRVEAEYKDGKVATAISYYYDFDENYNTLEYVSFYKKNKRYSTVWSWTATTSEDVYYLKDKNLAFKLWNQSTKTFKKKAKEAPDYRLFKKNTKKYVGKQFKESSMYVVQIEEYDDYDNTWIHVVDPSDSDRRYMLCLDGTNDILEGDYVNIWFTPTASGYYDTISGEQRFTVYGFCKAIEKVN